MPRTFAGPDLSTIMGDVRTALGPEAMILRVRRVRTGFEVAAAAPGAPTEAGGLSLDEAATAFTPAAPGNGIPLVIAIVGPTGAGKTTTIAKLASHPGVFGGRRVGLVCLDTYRIGAVEQIRTYAEIARLPFEVVYEDADLDAALRRLRHLDVILVDCPGRGPRHAQDTEMVTRWLERIGPHEIHLALPAGLSLELARRLVLEHRRRGMTHLLATKMDECPGDLTAFDLSARLGLPMRWMTDGQDVPTDLRPAAERLAEAALTLAAIGEPALAGAA